MSDKDRYEIRCLARSKAGHDRGKVYAVIREDMEYLFLADGKRKLLESPKKKKRKHVQMIRHLPERILQILKECRSDAAIRDALREYGVLSAAADQEETAAEDGPDRQIETR